MTHSHWHRRIAVPVLVGLAALGPAPSLRGADEDKPPQNEAKPSLAEAFQKGPVALVARVIRKDQVLPLFQVPVLHFQDRLEFTFSGEAFDPRVTQADWTLVVVFLPKTVAPTEKGVVSLALHRTPAGMVVDPIPVPYDAIPMVFLVPDTGGRRKILTDLNAHLADFRSICLKLSDLAEQRAHADRFLKSLEAIKQDQSAPSYDRAVFNLLKAYGSQLSQDLQIFLSRNTNSNLEKFQFLVSEFKRTNLLVPTPDAADRSVKVDGTSLSGNVHPGSLYIAIAFDLMQVFQNLWPGHKFQYIPALARDFEGFKAQLYYDEWIKTTGDVRGALVFSPCRWKDADLPAFQFELSAADSILHPYTLLKVQPKASSNSPLAMFGHDWKLALKAPGGEVLEPLPLLPNPGKQAFVIEPSPALEKLQQKGLKQVEARVEGRWGFEAVTTSTHPVPAGLDPAWKPTSTERDHFMVGQTPTFTLPAPWGAVVGKARFRPEPAGPSGMDGLLKTAPDGSCTLAFNALHVEPGPGFIDLSVADRQPAALSIPVALQFPLPVVDGIRAHQGENELLLTGKNLRTAQALLVGDQVFARSRETPEGTLFSSAKHTLAGEPGSPLEGTLRLSDRRELPVRGSVLLPPRPVLKSLEVIPRVTQAGLPLMADLHLVSTAAPILVSAVSGHPGRYALGRAPKVLLRNTEDPGSPVTLPATAVRLTGRGQRLLLTFCAADLLATRASGRLEIQVQDEALGSSAWTQIPALFLELPVVSRLEKEAQAWIMEGPSLESIEATASAAAGPWSPLQIGFHGEKQAAPVASPDEKGVAYLRLYGWPDLVIRVKAPIAAPLPAAGSNGAS
ncbi:MAG TPA: hypothetical protein VJ549_09075 [Geothrix sp.]|nr:hypothetical protein [Geothrix sp.]